MKSYIRQFNLNKVIVFIRISIGAFFVFSGLTKLWALSSFAETLSEYDFLPQLFVIVFSYGIPGIEILLGILLLFAWHIWEVSFLLLVMVFLFTIAAFVKYQNGQVGDCGCFGGLLERKNNWALFAENTVLMILLGIIQLKVDN